MKLHIITVVKQERRILHLRNDNGDWYLPRCRMGEVDQDMVTAAASALFDSTGIIGRTFVLLGTESVSLDGENCHQIYYQVLDPKFGIWESYRKDKITKDRPDWFSGRYHGTEYHWFQQKLLPKLSVARSVRVDLTEEELRDLSRIRRYHAPRSG